MTQPNRIKAAMRAGRKACGYGLTFPSPWVIDILGKLDFDYVFIWSGSRTCAGPPSATT